MKDHFEKEVSNLKSNLIKMASLVDEQVEQAFLAMETGNIELCKGIKAKDKEIDAYDNLIKVQCENIIALFQPVAVDLRFIISVLMINNQLERCGDIAVNISKRVKKTIGNTTILEESNILQMGKQAKEMLKKSIDSVINNNVELANEVLASDDNVDQLNKISFNFLVDKMKSDSNSIESCSHLIVLTRNIERLADHATNIAENLIFHIEAKIISHPKLHKEN